MTADRCPGWDVISLRSTTISTVGRWHEPVVKHARLTWRGGPAIGSGTPCELSSGGARQHRLNRRLLGVGTIRLLGYALWRPKCHREWAEIFGVVVQSGHGSSFAPGAGFARTATGPLVNASSPVAVSVIRRPAASSKNPQSGLGASIWGQPVGCSALLAAIPPAPRMRASAMAIVRLGGMPR